MARSYGYSAPKTEATPVPKHAARDLRDEPKTEEVEEAIRERELGETRMIPRHEIEEHTSVRKDKPKVDDKDIVDPVSAKVPDGARKKLIIGGILVGLVALGLMAYLVLFRLGGLSMIQNARSGNSSNSQVEQQVDEQTDYVDDEATTDDTTDEVAPEDESEGSDESDVSDENKTDDATAGVADEKSDDVSTSQASADLVELESFEGGYSVSRGIADTSGDTIVIRGRFRNDTDQVHDNVSLGVYLMDVNGTTIDLAVASTDKIEPGATWEWEAKSTVSPDKVFRFDLAEVRF